MFCMEENLRRDANVLLCLLLYNGYIVGSCLKKDLSLPKLVMMKMCLPFQCNEHWATSPNTESSLSGKIHFQTK